MKKVLYLMLLFVAINIIVGCNKNEEMKICQSCAMPLFDDVLGTEKAGKSKFFLIAPVAQCLQFLAGFISFLD